MIASNAFHLSVPRRGGILWADHPEILPRRGVRFRHIVPPDFRQRHWDGYRRVMQTGVSHYDRGDQLTVRAMRKDGTRIAVEFSIVPLKNHEGRVDGMAAILRDVTKRHEEMRVLKA
jgi:PAS domain S-box-containing protein